MAFCVRLWQVRQEKLVGSALAVYVREMIYYPNVAPIRAAGMVRAVHSGQLNDDERVVYAIDTLPQSEFDSVGWPYAPNPPVTGEKVILQRYLAHAAQEMPRLKSSVFAPKSDLNASNSDESRR